jgi:SAM-dependent methyltransferase
MDLLTDAELERSAVVANCRMNRERGFLGSNGYDREVGFNPLDVLRGALGEGRSAAWLDLCCGSGKALIEAAQIMHHDGLDMEIVGVDLAGMFRRVDPALKRLRLVEASLNVWRPDRRFGLHHVGDKLGLIARAASWLAEDGLFVASLDLHNMKIADGESTIRRIAADLRRAGLEYDRRRRLVSCRGRKVVDLPHRYLGANDRAGPNYTGQPAVDSYYETVVGPFRSG